MTLKYKFSAYYPGIFQQPLSPGGNNWDNLSVTIMFVFQIDKDRYEPTLGFCDFSERPSISLRSPSTDV